MTNQSPCCEPVHLRLLKLSRGFKPSRVEIFPGDSDGKESAGNAGDPGLIPGLGRSPGEGNSNPLQYSCLENPKDRGAGGARLQCKIGLSFSL